MANPLQEALEQMNQNPETVQLGGDSGKPSNPSPPETPVTPTPPVTPTTPASTTVHTDPKAGEKPPPTETVAATEPKKDNTAPTEPKHGEAPTPPATSVVDDVPDPVFYGRLSKLTEGSIKSEEDFVGLINHYNELLEQADEGFKPKFKDERTKLVYQLLADNAGREPEAAMRTLRALAFKPEGKTAQDKLFEAYLLDPMNSDLGPIEAQGLFQAEYNELYSDVEENPLKKRQLDLAVRKAEETITKVKEGFKPAEEQQVQARQISEQVERSIHDAVDNFGGIKMAFTDNPQESDLLTMAIDDQKELESLKQDSLNPQQWWNDFMGQFTNEQGQFDKNSYNSFVREFHEMRNHAKKAQLAYDHGFKLGQLSKVTEARNSSEPTKIENVGQPGSVETGPKSLLEAWAKSAG